MECKSARECETGGLAPCQLSPQNIQEFLINYCRTAKTMSKKTAESSQKNQKDLYYLQKCTTKNINFYDNLILNCINSLV